MTPEPPSATLFPYTTLFRSLSGPTAATAGPRLGHGPEDRLDQAMFRLYARLTYSAFAPAVKLMLAISPSDRKSTRLNSSHMSISYAVFCLKKKNYLVDHNET